MRSAATNPAASPIPPAHTRGTPRSPSSFTSCSALFGPACPPARWFTAIRPRTPESSPFSVHFRSVTSWYARPPTWATRSTTHRGLPNDVIKNRTPSSIATSTQRVHQLLGAVRSRMPARTLVHRDQAAHSRIEPFQRPLPLGHVVVHEAANLGNAVDDPPGLAQRRDKEPHALLDRHVHPALHT